MRVITVLALVIAALGGSGCSSSGGVDCPVGLESCNGECVNSAADPANCGSCGNACPTGQRCQDGFCIDMCSSGLVACDGFCVDTRSNLDNCGSCGNRCAPGQTCSGGTCTGGDCSVGLTQCGSQCVDLQRDSANCGRCGNRCEAGTVCDEGVCSDAGCPEGRTECDGECVDLDKDVEHCGRCDQSCAPGQGCVGGMCVQSCPPGETDCGGLCVDTLSSRSHCGRCGNACDAGQVCSAGTCETSCGGGLTDCSGDCVDTATDADHCGRCGNVCPAGEGCVGGDCGAACPEGETDCAGSCVDLATDLANCGRCGTTCRTDQVCRGACTCATGRTECSGACVDTRVDPANCGRCGTTCAATEACNDGTCTSTCGPGTIPCGGYCVNTSTDRNNCGRCGNVCGATQTCVGGVCIAGGGVPGDTCSSPIDVSGGGRFTGSTAGAGADYSGSCGGVTGGEVVFRFTLAATSDVHISTFGSAFDTLVYVRRETCGSGGDIACNDDSEHGSLQSEINLLDLPAGTYYVFLDAYSSFGSGDYVLDVYMSRPSGRAGDACGDPLWFDLATTTRLAGNTCHWLLWDFRDDLRACSVGSGGYDIVYYFLVTSRTTVSFETCGEASWDTVLDLRRSCSDETAAGRVTCNDDGCSTGLQSRLEATLDPGVYYLLIDGYSESACGDFEILVTRS